MGPRLKLVDGGDSERFMLLGVVMFMGIMDGELCRTIGEAVVEPVEGMDLRSVTLI
jgi:hypothetical protein